MNIDEAVGVFLVSSNGRVYIEKITKVEYLHYCSVDFYNIDPTTYLAS